MAISPIAPTDRLINSRRPKSLSGKLTSPVHPKAHTTFQRLEQYLACHSLGLGMLAKALTMSTVNGMMVLFLSPDISTNVWR